MPWFFIALGAPFLWAIVNLSDQYLVAKYSASRRGSGGLVLFSSLIGIFAAAIIGIFTAGIFSIPASDKLLLILAGGITIAWVILYLFALEIETVSVIASWFLTVPVFGYVLGHMALGETLTLEQIIGSAVVLFGALLISIDFSGAKRKIKWAPAAYMLAACFLIAMIGIIFKYVAIGGNFWVSSFWEYAGLGIFGAIIYIFVPKYREEFIRMNRLGGGKIIALNTGSEILTIIGNLLTNYALLLAPVTLVYLVGSFQPAIVLILTILATLFFPAVAKENLKGRVLLPKILAILIMIAGSAVLLL